MGKRATCVAMQGFPPLTMLSVVWMHGLVDRLEYKFALSYTSTNPIIINAVTATANIMSVTATDFLSHIKLCLFRSLRIPQSVREIPTLSILRTDP